MSLIQWIIDTTLKNPIVFDFQQKFCNDYSTVTKEFSEILNRNHIHILDVGCSTGTCAGQIIDMDANSYIGLDVVPRYIEIAQSRYKKGDWSEKEKGRLATSEWTKRRLPRDTST